MNRRQFLAGSIAALFASLLPVPVRAGRVPLFRKLSGWHIKGSLTKTATAPLPCITAAVDVLVPADPDIESDFKGSDYRADWIVADAVGWLGQLLLTVFLNYYALITAGSFFVNCTRQQQLDAIKAWVRNRGDQVPIVKDLLSGMLTLSLIGTYEANSEQEQRQLFTSMGWFDPDDPAGTFRIPNEGYPDSFQLPVRLKKGMSK